MSEIIPLKVGGSLLSTDSSALNFDYLFELRENLDRIASKHDLRFTINIGGGKLARSYMQAAKENGAVVENVHRVGVVTSNANVQLAHSVWGPTAYPKAIFYHDYDELIAGTGN